MKNTTILVTLLAVFFTSFLCHSVEKKEPSPEGKKEKNTESDNPGLTALVESKVDSKEGAVGTKDLPLNLNIKYDEKTFEEEETLSIYSLEKDLGIDSFERLSPIWAVKINGTFRKKAEFVFQFDKNLLKSNSEVVVLMWWGNNWILAGTPHVSTEDGNITIEANHGGWFVVARSKRRDEIKMKKYIFPDGRKRSLLIVGCFSYETKFIKGENALEEKIEFIEHFAGDITFGPIEGTKRTGISIFYAGATGNPLIQSFQGKVTVGEKKETTYATECIIPEQRGVISGQQKEGILKFGGMPTIMLLTGLRNDKKVTLPAMRGNLNLSGISFDWKLQEMFHLRNFVYKTELIMPHGAGDEQTRLVVYLQFIVK
jgi:hypothetical protein